MRQVVPWCLTVATVALQIVWVLVDGDRDALTIAVVCCFFLASASHALLHRGLAWASGFLVISAGLGLAVEILGTRTGFPFGEYVYGDSLGPRIGDVPVVVALAWSMMAYPCLLAGRALSASPLLRPLLAAWLLATWDIFLDSQMVADGHWLWSVTDPALPGIPAVPLQNYVGWLLTAFVLMLLLDRLPDRRASDGVPALLLTWTFVGNVVANAVFFDRPAVALWGGLLMGLVVLPWAWTTWTARR
ncbi:MAG: carotenoid biosynthesis protein [Actinomycetota bacterium]|nr:MAG: carotenoid biosynthesis protein [Actinomycetota bacterium]